MSEHRIKAAKFIKPAGPRFSALATGEEHLIIVGQKRARFVEFGERLYLSGSACPLPSETITETIHSSSAEGGKASTQAKKRISVIRLLAECLKQAKADPAQKLLVAGHTQAGQNEQQRKLAIWLAGDRARWIHCLLAGKRDAFAKLAVEAYLHEKDEDRRRLLAWIAGEMDWSCAPSQHQNDLNRSVTELQQSYNKMGKAGNTAAADLAVNGTFDQPTWGAIYDVYQHSLAVELEVALSGLGAYRDKLLFVGQGTVRCGGEKPMQQAQRLNFDDYRSTSDRRVEVLFFREGQLPKVPCLKEDCRPAACELFDRRYYELQAIPVKPLWMLGARLPSRFSLARTFVKPSAIPMLKELAIRAAANSKVRVLVMGHTDPGGPAGLNLELSKSRSKAVAALLTGDLNFSLERFKTPDPLKTWGWEEVQWMLAALSYPKEEASRYYMGLPDSYPGELTLDALGAFQLVHDLEVTYHCDAPTLKKLVGEYLALLGDQRPQQSQLQEVAGGESHPPLPMKLPDQETGDQTTSQTWGPDLRRVELFASDEPFTPPASSCPAAVHQQCKAYKKWCRSITESLDGGEPAFWARFVDLNQVPVSGQAVAVHRTSGPDTEQVASLTTSTFGAVTFAGAPGHYALCITVAGTDFWYGVPFDHPDDSGHYEFEVQLVQG